MSSMPDLRSWTETYQRRARWLLLDYFGRRRQEGMTGEQLALLAPAEELSGEAQSLVSRGLLYTETGLAQVIEDAVLTIAGRAHYRRVEDDRNNDRLRRIACRDAILKWLYDVGDEPQTTDEFMASVRHSHYLGRAFEAGEVFYASRDLAKRGLITYRSLSGAQAQRPRLQPEGERVIRFSAGSTDAADASQTPQGATFSIGHVSGGQVAMGSQFTQQHVNSPIDLDLAELVREVAGLARDHDRPDVVALAESAELTLGDDRAADDVKRSAITAAAGAAAGSGVGALATKGMNLLSAALGIGG